MTGRIQGVVTNPVTRQRYRIREILGEGGFGLAYLADELTAKSRVRRRVCLKTTTDAASWNREVYFGELLAGSRRVLSLHDWFPLTRSRRHLPLLFCLVHELAEHGTVYDYLAETGRPWSVRRAVREVAALARVLGLLHETRATHRDLTPTNVFVCKGGSLKIGDFGIACHELAGEAPPPIEAVNPQFVTAGFRDFRHRRWRPSDDVFQLAQLLLMLVTADATRLSRPGEVADHRFAPAAAEAIRRAIGPRSRRPESAVDFFDSLRPERAISTSPRLRIAG